MKTELKKGDKAIIISISEESAHYNDKNNIVGKRVIIGDRYEYMGGGFYSGFFKSKKNTWFIYKAKLKHV